MSGTTPPNIVPLLIGITGKRKFADDPAEDERIAERVRERLTELFHRLDARFRHTPKVLLTGGAYGTDLIAARAAMAMEPPWSVAVLLPYARNLFEKDFILAANGPDGRPIMHRDHATFCDLMEKASANGQHQVLAKVLPPLLSRNQQPATAEQLDKDHNNHDVELRHQHYEQVGQVIVETAMLVLAAMNRDEQPDLAQANGGTARVVALRRAGRPDLLGTDVARRSSVLDHELNELCVPPASYVWLLAPDTAAGRMPLTVLPPLTDRPADDVYRAYPGRDMPHSHSEPGAPASLVACLNVWLRDRRLALAANFPSLAPGPDCRALRQSLELLRDFDDFEALRQKLASRNGAPHTASVPPASMAGIEDPLVHKLALRRLINPPQGAAKAYSQVAFKIVAALFVVALLALEMFAKFFPTSAWPLGFYLAALIGITFVVLLTRWRLWQPRSEDYRAVSELIRVQRAWWAAGLSDRVDRIHLQGVDADLARPRDAARSIINWIWLRSSWPTRQPPSVEWSIVRDTPSGPANVPRGTEWLASLPRPPSDWIGEQIWYYARTERVRARSASRRHAMTWLLFGGSGYLAAILFTCMLCEPVAHWFDSLAMTTSYARHYWIAGVFWFGLAALIGWLRLLLHRTSGFVGSAVTVVCGTLAAICVGVALRALGGPFSSLMAFLGAEPPANPQEKLTVLVFVLLTAFAGAIRFLTEKLGFEAEALAYRDALNKFQRAEWCFARLADPVTGLPRDDTAARALVLELGTLALRENESWLKAHRERTLSPVVG